MPRRKRTPEEIARKERTKALMKELNIKDMDDIKVIDKHTYGKRYTESYVDSADDAIVTDYSAGTDFSFRYKGDGTLTIKCYVQGDALVCEINCDEAVG